MVKNKLRKLKMSRELITEDLEFVYVLFFLMEIKSEKSLQ